MKNNMKKSAQIMTNYQPKYLLIDVIKYTILNLIIHWLIIQEHKKR